MGGRKAERPRGSGQHGRGPAGRRRLPPGGADLHRAAGRVRLRRALGLLLITVLLPGSAQLTAGSRLVGRAALRVLGLLLVVAGLCWSRMGSTGLIGWALQPTVLTAVQVTLVVLGLCWAALLLDAWRIGRPLGLRRGHRLLCSAVVVALLAAIVTPLGYGVRLAGAQRDLVTSIFTPGGVGDTYHGRLNVAILGGDGGLDRTGIRTDQIAVASIDVHTGQSTLISVPRNLTYVRFPPGTAMANRFPAGYPQFLYGVYTYGAAHPDLFPGAANPGAMATEQALAQMLGIPIHFYVTLNLQGFVRLIDSLGGLTIRVGQRLPIGGGHKTGGCTLPGGGCREGQDNPILGWIEPGLHHLDGYQALWYARSRSSTNDYDRMARERCVLNGILKQMDPLTVLRHFQALVSSTKDVVQTDLTLGALSALVKVAADTRHSDVRSLVLRPPLIRTVQPDEAVVREHVQDAIAPPVTAATAAPAPAPGHRPRRAPPVVGLDQVCRYS